jgi:hypothetical protein
MDTLKVYKIIWLEHNVHTSFYIERDDGGGIEVHQSIYPDNGRMYIVERSRSENPHLFKLEESSPLNVVLIYGRTPEYIVQKVEQLRQQDVPYSDWIS